MARIAPTSRLFRSRARICADMAEVLRSQTLHYGTKRAVVDQALWVWSEFDGKYAGCPIWSQAAKGSGLKSKGLIHEHVVPREIVRTKLFDLTAPTPESVSAVMTEWCIGAVILKTEDDLLNRAGLNSRMPENWDGNDRFARYRAVGIKIAAS